MHPMTGIALKLFSVMLFIIMSSLIKATSGHVPPGEAVFFRSAFAVPVILVWLWARGDLATGLRVKSPMAHLWRGILGTTAMAMMFAGLGLLPLPEVTALSYAAPLLTVVFAAVFLREKVGIYRFGAVALGMAGVLTVLSPRLTGAAVEAGMTLGAALVLTGATCVAMVNIYLRKLVQTEQTSAIVFYFSITATCLSLLTLPFGWQIPSGTELLMLVLAGIFGGSAQIFMTSAYRFADASVIAPFDYASILFALIIGYLIFDEVPTLTVLCGAALVITAGCVVILRERQLGLKRGQVRKVKTPLG
ncbi:Riboflavin transporter [Roseovarius litorisediminis]|uniref:Riboflavin transporter n=1 Tax=Roseovarius litorisediminis TaxID=1312363 RepID=A0A1Y5RKJ2_9RHOB|nr:DMT family transporter [Roseovarius litorisediminis]SLN18539.1 Riboflavin transporter [Roseovarius litorisediminis]